MSPIVAHAAQNTQAAKRREGRAPSVQRHEVVHLLRVFPALLAAPVGRAQLLQPQQRPLAGGVDLTSDSTGHQKIKPAMRVMPSTK